MYIEVLKMRYIEVFENFSPPPKGSRQETVAQAEWDTLLLVAADMQCLRIRLAKTTQLTEVSVGYGQVQQQLLR
jgi:hypothetical protein